MNTIKNNPIPYFRHALATLIPMALLMQDPLFAASPNSNFQPSQQTIQDQARKFQMKALCLYNFANFVEWPDHAFSGDKKLKLCIVGRSSLGGFLKSVDGTKVGKRELEVVRSPDGLSPDVLSGCHILYVDIKDQVKLANFFNSIDQNYVLSVGDQPQFASKWGSVNIFNIKEGAKIEINLKRVYDSGLSMSSDLLGIAKIVNYEHAVRASR